VIRSVLVLVVLTAMPLFAAETEDCLVLPSETVDLGGAIPGQIAAVYVDPGDVVKAGDLIAELDSSIQRALLAQAEFRAQNGASVAAAEARLAYETTELERARALVERGVATAAALSERETAFEVRARELEAARAEQEEWRLEKRRAEAELRIRQIIAPIDAVVAERYLDTGEFLRDDGQVVTLVKLDPLTVEIFLPREDYAAVMAAREAEVWTDDAETPLTARIEQVDRVIDAASGTFRVRLSLANPEEHLIAGIRCRAVIEPPSQ